jgi:hypothetical protein
MLVQLDVKDRTRYAALGRDHDVRENCGVLEIFERYAFTFGYLEAYFAETALKCPPDKFFEDRGKPHQPLNGCEGIEVPGPAAATLKCSQCSLIPDENLTKQAPILELL